MNLYTKEQHRTYSIILHLIIVVKYRQKVFDTGDIINDMKLKLKEISNSFDVKILEQECGIDHIHLLISIKPTLNIPKYINALKGHSSRYIRKEYKNYLKDKLWGDNFWSARYFLVSSGNVSIDILKNYINSQRDKSKDEE